MARSPSFAFECAWDEPTFHKFMQKYVHYCWLFSGLYVIVIFGLKRYMENRPRFALRTPMILWSGSLALFSIAGAIRTCMGTLIFFANEGVYPFICQNGNPLDYCDVAFWGMVFTLSKVVELGDTLFIVLRKQPLMFLHWYHHITVLIYNWYSYAEHAAPGKVFYTINYTVHAFMYSYYTCAAMGYKLPVLFKKFITVLQLSQMVVGCSMNAYSYYLKTHGAFCEQSYDNLLYSSLMYFSYFLLFAKFYYDAYVQPRARPIKKDDSAIRANGFHGVSGKDSNGNTLKNRTGNTLKNGTEKESRYGNSASNGLRQRPHTVNGSAHE